MITDQLVGKVVTVFTSEDERRNTFGPALSVNGMLEYFLPRDTFRIVVSNGIYTYFYYENVVKVTSNPSKFKDGSIAVIKIKL